MCKVPNKPKSSQDSLTDSSTDSSNDSSQDSSIGMKIRMTHRRAESVGDIICTCSARAATLSTSASGARWFYTLQGKRPALIFWGPLYQVSSWCWQQEDAYYAHSLTKASSAGSCPVQPPTNVTQLMAAEPDSDTTAAADNAFQP